MTAELNVEFLWFQDCPNHETARTLLHDLLAARGLRMQIDDIEVPDEATGDRVRFPGSPTIRINGRDVEPGVEDCVDCTPRCRIYHTRLGLRGIPEREWIEAAIDAALAATS